AEEGVLAVAGAVVELVGDEDVRRPVLQLQRAYGRDGDELLDSQHLEAVDVGAVVDLGGQQAMAAAVAGQKGHGAAFQLAEDIGVRRNAERCLDPALFADLHPLHLVQAAAADNTDTDVSHQGNSSFYGNSGTAGC